MSDPNDDRAYEQLMQRIRIQIADLERRMESTEEGTQRWYVHRRLVKLYRLQVAIGRQYPELSPDL